MRRRTAPNSSNAQCLTPFLCLLLLTFTLQYAPNINAETPVNEKAPTAQYSRFLDRYCITCHDETLKTAGLELDKLDLATIAMRPDIWEKVVKKLHTATMPPPDRPQPSNGARASILNWLTAELDTAAAARPNPGRTEALRRLNRTEYQSTIRDLLALDINAESLLPHDESGHGFDNVNVGDLSPTLLDRYLTAAQKISKLAVGRPDSTPQSEVIRMKPDLTQEKHVPGLPIGTRGGALIPYTFPQDGEYQIQIWLTRDRNEAVESLKHPHDIDLLLDRKRIQSFTVEPPKDRNDYTEVDKHLVARLDVSAGLHNVGVTFPKIQSSLLETGRQPHESRFNLHRHPRTAPAVYQVSITGPFNGQGAKDTASRRKIFTHPPTSPEDELSSAKEILSSLMRRAYRRPVTERDLAGPMTFFEEGRAEADFDLGIERALTAILVSPSFIFRIEREAIDAAPDRPYVISNLELASRLSFFLWSSIPDEELLDTAIAGRLRRPEELKRQTLRMLADPKARNLASNFAGQWLHLRKLENFRPDNRLYPDFDDNLRQAMREETERFINSILQEDRSVVDLLKADYTFLNERLAKHYGIPYIYGTRFRRVKLDSEAHRGGLLRHGSILTVTSYATRTSPVLRGKWVLENILGAPPPPPPPNVSSLDNNIVSTQLPMRQRLAEHRSNPACISCHLVIDPPGFAMENFDPIGRWRSHEQGLPVDVSGGLPGVGEFDGIAGLEYALLSRPELFVGTLTEKLLTFALGRGIDYYDAPAIRQILREAEKDNYRFSAVILGIVNSTPFQMRNST